MSAPNPTETALPEGCEIRPFGDHAAEWLAYGKAVIPLDDKGAAVGNWQLMGRPASRRLAANPKWASKNLGVLTGWINRLTVIDIDTTDSKVAEFARDVFGEPVLMAETASGKPHFYFRHSAEAKLCNAFKDKSCPIDILGNGAYAAAPPSRRNGCSYRFIKGGLEDLVYLTPVKPTWRDALPSRNPRNESLDKNDDAPAAEMGGVDRFRNKTLFDQLRPIALDCDTRDALLTVACAINSTFRQPMEESRVLSTVKSVWRMKLNDSIITADSPAVMFRMPELNAIRADATGNGPYAMVLLAILQQMHKARGEPFSISPKAMARDRVIGDWTARTYTQARDWLLARGFIIVVREGGRGEHDPFLYAFSKGAIPLPNITYVPSRALSPQGEGGKKFLASPTLRAATEHSRRMGWLQADEKIKRGAD